MPNVCRLYLGVVAPLFKPASIGGTPVRVRAMRLADYDEVHALWLSCAGMGLNAVDDTRDGIARLLAENLTTRLVAEAPAPGAAGTADAHVTTPGRIFGSILVGTDGRRAAVYHTAVHPDMQVKGVGRVLVEAELDALRALGVSKAFLVAFRRNATSNAFWERMSFSERLDITYRDRALRDIVRSDT